MPISHAMWMHGHSTRIEYPERMTNVARMGSCIRMDGNSGTSNWFHVAVPTPVIVDDNRLKIQSVMLRFRVTDATVVAVHIYDGDTKVATYDGLALSPVEWSVPRFDVPTTPEVRWGIGISFKAQYGTGSVRRIEVGAGGGDFLP